MGYIFSSTRRQHCIVKTVKLALALARAYSTGNISPNPGKKPEKTVKAMEKCRTGTNTSVLGTGTSVRSSQAKD